MKFTLPFLLLACCLTMAGAQSKMTYAEKLGYPKGAKVILLHVDDMGMSYDSNLGGWEAMTDGVANSCSVMMPCPWVPGFVHQLKEFPDTDAGLHLTLTSEWKAYRWGPLSGKNQVPGLTDSEGAMWSSVSEVVRNASPDEIEIEIRAQIERAKTMGFEPTHLDSHMGTLFASQEFLERYLKIGIEYKIPVMFPGGHNTLITREMQDDIDLSHTASLGKMLWDAGLPLLDDLHASSYGWKPSPEISWDDQKLQAYTTDKYIELLKEVQPGITMIIMHCNDTSEDFIQISDSGPVRRGDYLAMIDPRLKSFIEQEGFILTTWREMMKRRQEIE